MLGKILLIMLFGFNLFAVDKKTDDAVDKEYNFVSIKKVLKQDMLDGEADKKVEKMKAIARKKRAFKKSKYNVPGDGDFWTIVSEYWLVKNATVLKWDFKKPDYGLEETFKNFLEKMGHYNKKFKILVVDSPNIFHLALPTRNDEYIFLLSLPFMRSLDLSKLEIALVLYEDYFRSQNKYFKKYLSSKDVKSFIGSNYFGKKLKKSVITDLHKKIDYFVFEKGFDFQSQFEVTKMMDTRLKNHMKLWNSYYRLKQKIDDLVKTNIMYKKYNSFYPSTELQLNWLNPKS